MKYIYAVKDSATDTYGMPFFLNTRQEAIRHFSDAVRANPEQSMIAKHPEDYTLHELGKYNEVTGHFDPEEPEQVYRGKDAVIQGA